MPETIRVIFFDLGDTLGSAVLSPPPVHLFAFDVYPFVAGLLSELQGKGLRLGIISNTGDDDRPTVDAVLNASGILDYFDSILRLYSRDVGLTKNSPAIFSRAAELAGFAESPQRCLLVGVDATERGFAIDALMRVWLNPIMIGEAV